MTCKVKDGARLLGVVQRFDIANGVGVIETEDGELYPLVSNVIRNVVPLRALEPGQRVRFTVAYRGDKTYATSVDTQAYRYSVSTTARQHDMRDDGYVHFVVDAARGIRFQNKFVVPHIEGNTFLAWKIQAREFVKGVRVELPRATSDFAFVAVENGTGRCVSGNANLKLGSHILFLHKSGQCEIYKVGICDQFVKIGGEDRVEARWVILQQCLNHNRLSSDASGTAGILIGDTEKKLKELAKTSQTDLNGNRTNHYERALKALFDPQDGAGLECDDSIVKAVEQAVELIRQAGTSTIA